MTEATQPVVLETVTPCPRCGELLSHDQAWCTRCGDPARTLVAPTPRWRRPIGVLLTVLALSLGALIASFVAASNDDPPPARTVTSTITTQPGETLPEGVIPAPAVVPAPAVSAAAGASGAAGAALPPASGKTKP